MVLYPYFKARTVRYCFPLLPGSHLNERSDFSFMGNEHLASTNRAVTSVISILGCCNPVGRRTPASTAAGRDPGTPVGFCSPISDTPEVHIPAPFRGSTPFSRKSATGCRSESADVDCTSRTYFPSLKCRQAPGPCLTKVIQLSGYEVLTIGEHI